MQFYDDYFRKNIKSSLNVKCFQNKVNSNNFAADDDCVGWKNIKRHKSI